MEKGQLGIRYAFYAVAAFVLAFLGYSTGLFILAAVVVAVEKNEWATKQIIQACVMLLFVNLFHEVFGWLDVIYRIPWRPVVTAWEWVNAIVDRIFYLVMMVLYIIAIVRVAGGKEAKVPLASALANWACGVIAQKAPKAAPAPATAPTVETPVAAAPAVETPVAAAPATEAKESSVSLEK